jgi:PAS domain S-box-containing protein
MSDKMMHIIPYAQFFAEMRSGKIISIDEGFTKMLGYTQEDVDNGLVFKQFLPDVEYNEVIAELREQFISQKYACYRHGVICKDGEIRMVVAFFTIQNKLLNGHRVLEVSVADVTDFTVKE